MKTQPKEWSIMFTARIAGTAIVRARSASEALRKFDAGDWEHEQCNDTSDVERQSEPERVQ